ncbi:diguanylate cyclase [Oxalobacteraceae bacterium A2-2]
MHTYELVSSHISAMGLPLYAVSAARADAPGSPLLLFLHWHGFRRATPLQLPGVPLPARAVPSSALQLDGPWPDHRGAEQELLDAAWRLGAWSLERVRRRPCNWPGAPASEAYDCRLAFGDNAAGHPDAALVEEPPARAGQMALAAQKGYSRWLFQPVKGGLWAGVGPGDDSLAADGGRASDCPVRAAPPGPAARTVYQLGRLDRIIVL